METFGLNSYGRVVAFSYQVFNRLDCTGEEGSDMFYILFILNFIYYLY